jgi:Tol biopolymer transport system component
MRRKIMFSAVFVALVALIATLSASASFPGKNGKIVLGSEHAGEDEIWVMNPDGTDRHNLTRHDGAKISDIDPRWSPDGRQIVYGSDPSGSLQIWIMNANGSSPRALTTLPGRNRYPAFTADGKQIVFQSFNAGNFEILRMNTDGSEVTNLTNDPGVDWAPATSPRGKKIVFTRERDNDGDLYIWSPDKPLVRLTNTTGYDYYANWSPNGNDLVFVREDTSGGTDLYLAHSDGTGERRLTTSPSRVEYFPAFSPDGTQITYTACGPPKPQGAPNPVCSTRVINLDGSGDVDLAFPAAAVTLPFSDNFGDDVRNVEHWNLLHDGTGGFVEDTNGRVELTLKADAVPSSRPSPAIEVRYGFQCLLNADYDARVDYELLDWPASNGATFQMHAFFADATIGRQSQNWGESYGAFVPPSSFDSAPTLDRSGTLRLVRNGRTYSSYYRSGGAWVELLTATAGSSPVVLTLELASYGTAFAHQQVKVAFDNFRLEASDVDCSPSTPDWHPDWQPIMK